MFIWTLMYFYELKEVDSNGPSVKIRNIFKIFAFSLY